MDDHLQWRQSPNLPRGFRGFAAKKLLPTLLPRTDCATSGPNAMSLLKHTSTLVPSTPAECLSDSVRTLRIERIRP
jgi:hypothetical protein